MPLLKEHLWNFHFPPPLSRRANPTLKFPLWINSNGQSGTNLIKKFFTLLDMELTQSLNVTADNGYAIRVRGGLYDFPGFDPETQLLVGVNWPAYAHTEEIRERFSNLPANTFGAGHMLYTPAAGRLFEELEYKVILIVREPKDWAYSNARRVLEVYTGDKMLDIKYFLKIAVFGEAPGLGQGRYPMVDRYEGMAGWLRHRNVCLVKFEDIVGEMGGGSNSLLFNEMDRIADHLEIKLSKANRRRIVENLFGGTRTFKFGQIGKWKEQADFFNQPAVRDLVARSAIPFGY